MKADEIYVVVDSKLKRKIAWDILKEFGEEVQLNKAKFMEDGDRDPYVILASGSYKNAWNLFLYDAMITNNRNQVSIDKLIEILSKKEKEYTIGCETFTYTKDNGFKSQTFSFSSSDLMKAIDLMETLKIPEIKIEYQTVTLQDMKNLMKLKVDQ